MQPAVTTAQLFDTYEKTRREILIAGPLQTRLLEIEKGQREEEENLVRNGGTCQVPLLANLRDRLPSLDAELMRQLSQQQMYNVAVLDATSCITDSIFYGSPYDIGALAPNDRIRLFFQDLKRIGTSSVEGYALLSDLKQANNMYVVKAPQQQAKDGLLHEAVVGLYGLNAVRALVPNYVYVYGTFKCSPPLIDSETGEVVTWCLNNDNLVNYVVYENISPAISAKEYMRDCTVEEFLVLYMQVLYALRTALSVCDYTHYDLHSDNVLLRDVLVASPGDTHFQILYQTERGEEYMRVDRVATIIDYGFSHIEYQGKHYGKSGLVPLSIFPDQSWPMHDVYKFLMFCLHDAYRYDNLPVVHEASKIFRFFNDRESPTDVLTKQYELRFAFPYTRETSRYSLDDLATYIRLNCDCDFIRPEAGDLSILRCDNSCYTASGMLRAVGMDKPVVVQSVVEAFDLLVRMRNSGKMETFYFDYPRAMSQHLRETEEMLRRLSQLQLSLRLVDLRSFPLERLMSETTLHLVRSTYLQIGEIVDLSHTIELYIRSGLYLAQEQGDRETQQRLERIRDSMRKEISPAFAEASDLFNSNEEYLASLASSPQVQEYLRQQPQLAWYWSERKLYDEAIGTVVALREPSSQVEPVLFSSPTAALISNETRSPIRRSSPPLRSGLSPTSSLRSSLSPTSPLRGSSSLGTREAVSVPIAGTKRGISPRRFTPALTGSSLGADSFSPTLSGDPFVRA